MLASIFDKQLCDAKNLYMRRLKIISILIMLLSIQSLSAKEYENLYFTRTVNKSFEDVTEKVKDALIEEGFGIVTEIDLNTRIMAKLDGVEMRPYKILGPCNAEFAYHAFQDEENIGLFLPCRIIIKDMGDNLTEVVMVNPTVYIGMLGEKKLEKVASRVKTKYLKILEKL